MISILGFEIRRKRKFGYEYWIKLSDIKISDDFKMRIKFITENIRECKYCNLYYFKINDYKSKYFHFIGNDTTNLPKPPLNTNTFLDFKSLKETYAFS